MVAEAISLSSSQKSYLGHILRNDRYLQRTADHKEQDSRS